MKTKHALFCVLAIFAFALSAEPEKQNYVWWEAEDPVSHNFPPAKESPFYIEKLDAEKLSGGDWISANKGNKGAPYTATYEITVPKTGTYTLWGRKCWHHALFTWKFENGPEGEVTRDIALLDGRNLRPKVGAHWVDLGPVNLAEGKHRFTFTQTGTDKPKGGGFFGIDCFALIPFAWKPNGKLRPGEVSGLHEEGWTAFEPKIDTFTDKALLDLRNRNHKLCGEKGRAILKDGDIAWAESPEERVRFWGQVIGRSQITASDQSHRQYLRRMAKLGVNMVRLHGAFHGGVEGDPLAISEEYLDRFDHFVATCRENGVYFMVNTWYDHWIKNNLIGEKGQGHPNGWQFIHPEGRALWKRWATRLFDRVNPYTGMRNSEDPTIAIIQLSNEDNYFFHNFQPYRSIPVSTMQYMEKRFAEWLRGKYGSLEKAYEAWSGQKHKRDNLQEGHMGLLRIHSLVGAGQRGRDQAAFQVYDYRAVTDEFIEHLRNIGYDGLVNNGNWLSADPRILEPLDKLANMNGEVMSRHGVNLRSVTQLEVFYAIGKGDKYKSVSSLYEPWRYPVMEVHYNDRAHMVCEPKASDPNRYRAEWPPIIACWGALQGMDAQMHFAGSINWLSSTSSKLWGIDAPVFMGQSPACSLIYREGYIRQAPVVIEEKLYRQSLLDLKGAGFATISTLNADEIQPGDIELVKLGSDDKRGLNPLALMVGSMHREIVDDPAKAGLRVDRRVEQCIDAENKVLRSVTGELELNWGKGLLRILAPKAQGAVGFLAKAGTVDLPDLAVDCQNEYASVLCVSLDGKDLSKSEKILLTVVTEEHDYGYRTKPAKLKPRRGPAVEGVQISELGSAPIQHLNPEAVIAFKRSDAAQMKVTALDWNGYPVDVTGNARKFQLRPDVIHYIIEK